MKILVLGTIVLFLVSGVCVAEELNVRGIMEKLPPLKQGIAYSLMDHDISYLSTVELLNWRGIALEAGYSSKDKAVAVVSYELLKLKDLGVTVPVLDLIEARIGAYAGYGKIDLIESSDDGNWEYDYGLSATLINVKF